MGDVTATGATMPNDNENTQPFDADEQVKVEQPDRGEKRDDGEELGDSGRKALHSERAARREAERRAEEAEQRFAALERANETEAEKRIREAETHGRTAGARDAAGALLRDSLAAVGLEGDDLEDAVDDFNLDRVVKDGRVDMARVRRYVARFGKDSKPAPQPERRGDSGHGAGTGQPLGDRELAAAVAAQRGWTTN